MVENLEIAKWIGSPLEGTNTAVLSKYSISVCAKIDASGKFGVVFAARDKDNYLEVLFDRSASKVSFAEYTDQAWRGSSSDGFGHKRIEYFSASAKIPAECKIGIKVSSRSLTVCINDKIVVENTDILPENPVNEPRKEYLLNFGIKDYDSSKFDGIVITNDENGVKLLDQSRESDAMLLSVLSEGFSLVNPVPAVYLKRCIKLESLPSKAELISTARGFYEVFINGERVSDEFFAPGFTDYRLRIDVQKEDVTRLLKEGENEITAIVSKGYYSGFCGYSGAMNYGEENSFLANLICEYEGASLEFPTDENWMYSPCCPVQYGDFQDGEYHDARLLELSKKPEAWTNAGVKEAPGAPIPTNGQFDEENAPEFTLSEQQYYGAHILETLVPVKNYEMPKSRFVYDFGQNIVGTVRVKIKAAKGTQIKLRYGEMCYQSGEVYVRNLRTAANTDVYVCAGDGEEVFCPSHTGHGFRYLEITGNGYDLEDTSIITSVEALVLCNLTEVTGEFECSDPLINRLEKNILWGQKGNYLLVPTDCPQRNERMGWTGDAQVFASTAAYHMDVKEFTRKWLLDLREGQLMYNKNGGVPDTAPLGGDNRKSACGGWADAAVIVPWELYMEYGDKEILAENYDMMQQWIEYQSREDRECEGIQVVQPRGDHLAFDTSTPSELCATAYAAYVSFLMSKIANVLGFEDDEKKYADRFEYVKKAFQKKWVNEDGTITVPSQTAYSLALDFDLLEEKHISGAAAGLVKAIEERDMHLSVGFLGIAHLLPALTKVGRNDIAAKLLMQKTNPGWLYSVLNGATTIWERWNSYIAETDTFGDVSMNSFNHYAYGAVGDWMYTNILGIKKTAPAYEELILAPTPIEGLTSAKGWHKCSYGIIKSEWEINNGYFNYSVTIPDGVKATVLLPSGEKKELKTGGNYTF